MAERTRTDKRRSPSRTAGVLVAAGGLVALTLGAVAWSVGGEPSPAGAQASERFVVEVAREGGSGEVAVGEPVTYTVRIRRAVDNGSLTPVVGAQPSVNVATSFDVSLTDVSCSGGTDAQGICRVRVVADQVASARVVAQYPVDADPASSAVGPTTSWVDQRVTVTPASATANVGTSAAVDVAVERSQSGGWVGVPGAFVELTIAAGPGRISTVPAGVVAVVEAGGRRANVQADASGRIRGLTLVSPTSGTTTLQAAYAATAGSGVPPVTGTADVTWRAAAGPISSRPPASSSASAPASPAPASTVPATAVGRAPASTAASASTAITTTTSRAATTTATVAVTTTGASVVTVAPATAGVSPAQAGPTTTGATPVTPPTVPAGGTSPTSPPDANRAGPVDVLPRTGVLAGALTGVGASMLLFGLVLWTAGPRIREHFRGGLR